MISIFYKGEIEVARMAGRVGLNDLPVDGSELRVEHVITPNCVRDEAQRRIIALTGASSLIGTIVKQSNANMRANELNDIRINGNVLTTAEQAEADALRGLANAIKAIRVASNVLEPLDPIPDDYADDKWWTT